MDRQHRQIVECCNTFFIRYKCCQGPKAIRDCLSFLQQYILYHFQTEEAYMVECGYPAYRAHQAAHMQLSTRVKFFTVRLEASGYAPEVSEEFHSFLIHWMEKHLMEEDREFALCYREYRRQKQQDKGTDAQ